MNIDTLYGIDDHPDQGWPIAGTIKRRMEFKIEFGPLPGHLTGFVTLQDLPRGNEIDLGKMRDGQAQRPCLQRDADIQGFDEIVNRLGGHH